VISKIILFLKRLLGIIPNDKDVKRKARSLKKKIEGQEKKIKEIENEKNDLNSLVDYLNK